MHCGKSVGPIRLCSSLVYERVRSPQCTQALWPENLVLFVRTCPTVSIKCSELAQGSLGSRLTSRVISLGLDKAARTFCCSTKSELGDVFYGYHDQPAAFNSLKVSRELLVANGHPADKIALIDASAFDQVNLPKLDLVTSLIAWGFHFPVATYLEAVHTSLHDEGVLILDVRKDTSGREVLQNRFKTVTTILDDLKFERIVARK